MGGYGSGRQGGRPTVESGLTLDINRLLRQHAFFPGQHVSGVLRWSNTRTRESVATIGYEASLVNLEGAWARLHYTADGTAKDYRVQLEATPCHYGGLRWWWICPASGLRAGKLYLPSGATMFAARKAYRLGYQSQREGAMDRTHARQARVYRKLGGTYEYHEQPPPRRPKGMHHTTYERLEVELYAAMDAHEAAFITGASTLVGRLQRAEARCPRRQAAR